MPLITELARVQAKAHLPPRFADLNRAEQRILVSAVRAPDGITAWTARLKASRLIEIGAGTGRYEATDLGRAVLLIAAERGETPLTVDEIDTLWCMSPRWPAAVRKAIGHRTLCPRRTDPKGACSCAVTGSRKAPPGSRLVGGIDLAPHERDLCETFCVALSSAGGRTRRALAPPERRAVMSVAVTAAKLVQDERTARLASTCSPTLKEALLQLTRERDARNLDDAQLIGAVRKIQPRGTSKLEIAAHKLMQLMLIDVLQAVARP